MLTSCYHNNPERFSRNGYNFGWDVSVNMGKIRPLFTLHLKRRIELMDLLMYMALMV